MCVLAGGRNLFLIDYYWQVIGIVPNLAMFKQNELLVLHRWFTLPRSSAMSNPWQSWVHPQFFFFLDTIISACHFLLEEKLQDDAGLIITSLQLNQKETKKAANRPRQLEIKNIIKKQAKTKRL